MKDKEIEMLRLDVERLKGELAAARAVPSGRRTPPFGGGNLPAAHGIPWHPVQQVGALEAAFAKMPADATCGGPGRCGRLGCGHPGWGVAGLRPRKGEG